MYAVFAHDMAHIDISVRPQGVRFRNAKLSEDIGGECMGGDDSEADVGNQFVERGRSRRRLIASPTESR